MKKTFACAVRPNKAPSMRRGLSIISLEHSYGLNGSRIFDWTQLAPKCNICSIPPQYPTGGPLLGGYGPDKGLYIDLHIHIIGYGEGKK